jgi:integrase
MGSSPTRFGPELWCGRRDLNPGSQAWRACVLNQTRRRPHSDTSLNSLNTVINPIATGTEETIVNTLIALRNDGIREATLRQISFKLKELARNCDITNPEAVKAYIATAKNQITREPLADETRNKFAYAYDKYCEKQQIIWKKPFYKVEEKTPLIPTTENVNAIINTASKRYAVIFKILAEIGAEGHELEKVSQSDIDAEQGLISIRGCKGHASGTYKLKTQTAEMLRIYLHKNPQENPFPRSVIMGQVWRDTRERASTKLCKHELNNIPLKNLRNYSGAQLYYKLPDPIAVMRHLRHKKLETTMHYIRGITTGGEEEYICKTAQTLQEATALIEQGFQYITEIDGTRLFKKRK